MEFIIKEAKFIASYPNLKACPKSKVPEFAFIGRSNVGKSSLINAITNRRNLALTSATPGKTRLLNFFMVNNGWHLVDLPGYGYAKVSKEKRSVFQETILEYIGKRENLYCLFVLVDSRIPPQEIDVNFINWLGQKQIPFVILFTKADKISNNEKEKCLKNYSEQLRTTWAELPRMIFTSATKKTGREEVLAIIQNALEN
jgi:GTP-binding protein